VTLNMISLVVILARRVRLFVTLGSGIESASRTSDDDDYLSCSVLIHISRHESMSSVSSECLIDKVSCFIGKSWTFLCASISRRSRSIQNENMNIGF